MDERPRTALRSQTEWLELIDRSLDLAGDEIRRSASEESVSLWTVAQHLEHLLLADASIVGILESTAAGPLSDEQPGRPSTIGYLVVWTGYIPRGRGKAPDFTIPVGQTAAEVAAGLRDVHRRVTAIEQLLPAITSDDSTRAHPRLGHFTPMQWLRFAQIHNRHHHKIMRDILRSPAR